LDICEHLASGCPFLVPGAVSAIVLHSRYADDEEKYSPIITSKTIFQNTLSINNPEWPKYCTETTFTKSC